MHLYSFSEVIERVVALLPLRFPVPSREGGANFTGRSMEGAKVAAFLALSYHLCSSVFAYREMAKAGAHLREK